MKLTTVKTNPKPYYFESEGQALINHDQTLIKILV